ncbi:MAG: hypothetical protein H0W88_12460 [Parachlamydiaceae bacterium]|nr:hypothetical protein [Parachlamydiaceae bacterium]
MNYLRRISYGLLLFVTCFSTFLFSCELESLNGWAHLELGAGNYGPDGHTKASQSKTVLMKLEEVSNEKNYIDELEEVGRNDYKAQEQYGILFWTLDQLISRYGDVGVFHVNDLYEEYAEFATQKLMEYALTKGYDSIVIEAVSGDYQQINSEQTLSKFGKTKYTSAHLKNPEVSLYHNRMAGDHFSSSINSRENTRLMLKKLANLSEEGLYLFILYHENFVPLEERTEYMEKEVFYHKTDKWEPVPYIFPEGNIIDKDYGRVFHISPSIN